VVLFNAGSAYQELERWLSISPNLKNCARLLIAAPNAGFAADFEASRMPVYRSLPSIPEANVLK